MTFFVFANGEHGGQKQNHVGSTFEELFCGLVHQCPQYLELLQSHNLDSVFVCTPGSQTRQQFFQRIGDVRSAGELFFGYLFRLADSEVFYHEAFGEYLSPLPIRTARCPTVSFVLALQK